MPTIKGPIQGNRQQYLLRTGINIPEFHGINKQKDPAAIDENQFQSADNIRLRGGRMWARGGQSKFNGTAMTASCVLGIFDFNAGAVNILLAPKAGGTPQFYNSNYMQQPTDPDTFPLPSDESFSYTVSTTFPGLFPSGLTPTGSAMARQVFAKYRGQIIAYGSDGCLYKLLIDKENLTYPSFVDGIDVLGTVTLISELLFDPADSFASCVPNTYCQWREKLWMASRDGHVYVWDGSVFERDTTVALGAPTADGVIFQLFEDIYVCVSNALYRRNGGAWSTVTLPGSLTDFRPRAACVFQNNAYIVGGDFVDANNLEPVELKLVSPSTCTEETRIAQVSVDPPPVWAGYSEVIAVGSTKWEGYSIRNPLGENTAAGPGSSTSELFGSDSAPNIGFIRANAAGRIIYCTPCSESIGALSEPYTVLQATTPEDRIIANTGVDATASGQGEPPFWDAVMV